MRRGIALAAIVAVAGLAGGVAPAEVVWPPSPTEIPGSSPDADTAQVASLGGNGEAVAVWDVCGCGSAGVQAATFDGSTWSSAQLISSPAAVDAYTPQLTATSTGHVLAVWVENDGADLTIQAATFGGGSWSAPVPISGASSDVDAPGVAGRADGTAVAVWDTGDVNPGFTDIQAAAFDGTSWDSPVTLTAGNDSLQPQVAVTGAGTATAVWTAGGCGCGGTIQASTLTAGSWAAPIDLSPSGEDATNPVVTGTGAGSAVAAWVNLSGPTTVVQATTFDGTTWSGTVEPVSDPTLDVSVPFLFSGSLLTLTSTGTDHATAAWVSEDPSTGDHTVLAAARSATWASPVALSAPIAAVDGIFLDPDITTVDPGVALAVWEQVGVTSTIQAATYDGSAVTGPTNVASVTFSGFSALPQVTGTGEGTSVAVWTADDGVSSFSIQGALGAPSAVTKPVPGGDATISTSAGGLLHVKRTTLPDTPPPPAGVVFPYGLFSFDVVNLPAPGATTTVTVTLPGPVTQYWKLQNGAWAQLTNATFNGNHVTFTLTDGGTGDADHVANGTIVDPGGPAIAPTLTFTG